MSSMSSAPGSYRQPPPTGTCESKAAALPSSSKDGSAAARDNDPNGSTSSTSLPYPVTNPFTQMQHPFFAARSFMPMMPFGPMMLPEMMLPAASKCPGKSASGSSRSSCPTTNHKQQMPMMPPMLPIMPPFFPHPAQIQAMSAAAQAALAHVSKTGMPFPPGMMLPPFLFPMQMQQQPQEALAAGRKAPMLNKCSPCNACTSAQPVAGAATTFPAAAAADSASDDDEEEKVGGLDESIEVDAETEQLFEKVAALEREREKHVVAQAPRADSPCLSIHSACTRHPSSHPCSPTHTAAGDSSNNDLVSAAVFEEAASLSPAATGAAAEGDAVPLPWLSFAADDEVDDIDKDLAQIITLPEAYGATSNTAAAAARPSKRAAAGSADRNLRAMKRVGSVGSAISTGDALGISVAAAVPGTPGGATASPGAQPAATRPRSKLIKIKTTRGLASTAGAAAAGKNSSKASKLAKNPASRAGNSKSCSQYKSNTAAAGSGTAKGDVQKKSNSSSSPSKSKAKAVAAAAAKAKKSASPSKKSTKPQQLAVEVEEPCLGIRDELQSSLNDTCSFGVENSNEDMAIDSFEYLGASLQEPSGHDAWDGLLTTAAVGTADDVELCSVLHP